MIEERPWGSFFTLYEIEGHKVKILRILPGQSISLQKHEQREEEWHILQGRGEVHIEDDEGQDAKDRDFFYIPCGDKHRVRCTGEEPLVILEIQSGHYLEEDDIIRYEDDYGRA